MKAAALAGSLALACCLPLAADRRVAIVVDTSGSMTGSDRPRYTVQISQILGDLLAQEGELAVVRLPLSGSCSDGPTESLVVRLEAAGPAGFKRALDQRIEYGGDNHFAAPLRTAIATLGQDPAAERLLLFIADSGGLAACATPLTQELVAFRATGALVAAINLGGTAGAFEHNPGFELTTAALDAEQLIAAVATVYQRFLGAKRVQTGQVGGPIEVEVAPYVERAFLVVAADGPLPPLAPGAGNPTAKAVDLDHRGGGETRGLDGQLRGYRIIRLERPGAGTWTFEAPGLAAKAGWMLLQESALALRPSGSPQLVQGQPTPLEVELFDHGTGQRVTDPGALAGLSVRLELDGQVVELRDDGSGSDRQAGDGLFTASPILTESGRHRLPLHLESELLDRSFDIEVEVVTGSLAFGPATPVHLGPVGRGGEAPGALELQAAEVRGSFELEVTTDFDLERSWLEVDTGSGWVPLGGGGVALRLAETGPRTWPLRLRVGECPEGASRQRPFAIRLEAAGAPGGAQTLTVPLTVEVIADPWLRCWWPVLAALLGALLCAVIVYGFVSPSRFPPRLGVVLSPEMDLTEGFFHPIRAQRGSGSGFFRDARIFIRPDFRLSASPTGALARLRAHGPQVRLQPLHGNTVLRLGAEGTFEPLPPEEVSARFGVIYRNELGNLYFEVRNG